MLGISDECKIEGPIGNRQGDAHVGGMVVPRIFGEHDAQGRRLLLGQALADQLQQA